MGWMVKAVVAGLTSVILFSASPIHAQGLTKADEIEKALTPKFGGGAAPPPAAGVEPGERVRSMRTRGNANFAPEPIERQTSRIDLAVEFELNSDRLTPQGEKQLDELATAVLGVQKKTRSWNDKARSQFSLIGHTDARGSDELNDDLSRRRAEAVKRYLTANFRDINGEDFKLDWKGKRQLKVQSDPYAAANRRVEVVLEGIRTSN